MVRADSNGERVVYEISNRFFCNNILCILPNFTERVVDLSPDTLAVIVGGRATGLANVEGQKRTEARLGNLELSEGLSASPLKDITDDNTGWTSARRHLPEL